MTPLSRSETVELACAGPLFQELLELPETRRFRAAVQRLRGWRLEPGESPPPEATGDGVFVVLEGSAALPDEGSPRTVFAQWTGLRGLPPEEIPVAGDQGAVVAVLEPDLLALVLSVPNRFLIEFCRPLLLRCPALTGTPEETLDGVIRKSRMQRFRDGEAVAKKDELGNTMFFVLAGRARVDLGEGSSAERAPGDFFGESAVLSRQPRLATVTAEGDCLVLECGQAAVQELRRKNREFKRQVEDSYRRWVMLDQLRNSAFFSGLSSEELEQIREIGSLESFLPYEPVFFQGDPADALYLVVNGTLTVVEEEESGPRPLAWVREGESVGEIALLPEVSGTDRRGQTVTALQNVDAIRIGERDFREIAGRHPAVLEKLTDTARRRLERNAALEVDQSRADRLAWVLETEHVPGNQVLAVDMRACIRCNNCVAACQGVHDDGLNRFFWHEMREHDGVLPEVRLSNSCQHCEFPLCTRECPTQCIDRAPSGEVFIDYDRCIRCGKCADPNQGCPYGSIQIVPAEVVEGGPGGLSSLPFYAWFRRIMGFGDGEVSEADAPRTAAGKRYPVKCDLCHGLEFQACVYHCPTNAVFRLDGDRALGSSLECPPRAPVPERGTVELRVSSRWVRPPAAGRPGELEVHVSDHGDGTPVRFRRPEPGVHSLEVNLFLHVDDEVRVGGGGLRQLRLPLDAPRGHVGYNVTFRALPETALSLAVYQGGLYSARHPVLVPAG